MHGIFDIDLGPGAVVTPGPRGLVRRVRHRDTSLVVDGREEVGLVLNLSDAHRVDGHMAGLAIHDVPRVGSVTVMPPGCRFEVTIRGECRVLTLRLPWSTVVGAAAAHGSDPSRLDLRPSADADDPTLARLIYAAAAADEEDAPAAAAALAGHLVRHHAAHAAHATPGSRADAAPVARSRGGIARPRLRRVLDRITADLCGPLPITALAAEAGMSAFHFAREFARVTGLPPHQYLVRRRVDRAVVLLASPHLSIAEVARASGFAHASHLARQMRRLTGLAPEQFRACVVPPATRTGTNPMRT